MRPGASKLDEENYHIDKHISLIERAIHFKRLKERKKAWAMDPITGIDTSAYASMLEERKILNDLVDEIQQEHMEFLEFLYYFLELTDTDAPQEEQMDIFIQDCKSGKITEDVYTIVKSRTLEQEDDSMVLEFEDLVHWANKLGISKMHLEKKIKNSQNKDEQYALESLCRKFEWLLQYFRSPMEKLIEKDSVELPFYRKRNGCEILAVIAKEISHETHKVLGKVKNGDIDELLGGIDTLRNELMKLQNVLTSI